MSANRFPAEAGTQILVSHRAPAFAGVQVTHWAPAFAGEQETV